MQRLYLSSRQREVATVTGANVVFAAPYCRKNRQHGRQVRQLAPLQVTHLVAKRIAVMTAVTDALWVGVDDLSYDAIGSFLRAAQLLTHEHIFYGDKTVAQKNLGRAFHLFGFEHFYFEHVRILPAVCRR